MEKNIALNDLTKKMLLAFGADKANTVFSPFSILMLLGLAADGTDGKTAEEILSLISDGAPKEVVLTDLAALQDELTYSKAFKSANALAVKEELRDTIRPEYEAPFMVRFQGEVFGSSDLAGDVNSWVNEKTDGMIPMILDDSTAKALLACLMNAVCFKADWLNTYFDEDVADKTFHNLSGSEATVPFLNSNEYSFIQDDTFVGFTKEYEDSEYSFMALLPKEEGAEAFTKAVQSADFTDLLKKRTYSQLIVSFPEFTIDFSRFLKDDLNGLGVNAAFDLALADFSPMSEIPLVFSEIIHKAHIEVDRKGTRAAAVTAAFVMGAAAPAETPRLINLDRPFLFAIVHEETGLPIFCGTVTEL